MADLTRADFDACLAFLAGDLAVAARGLRARAGLGPALDLAPDLEAGRALRDPQRPGDPLVLVERRHDHLGGIGPGPGRRPVDRDARRGLRRAAPGRRPLRPRRPGAGVPPARGADRPRPGDAAGEPNLPRWSSDRQGLSAELARDLAAFRAEAGRVLADGPSALRSWLGRGARPRPRRGGRPGGPVRRPGAGQRDPGGRRRPRRGIPRRRGRRLRLRLPRPARPARLARRWAGPPPPGSAGGSAGT